MRRLKANANHGVAAATTAPATPTPYDAGPGQRLLAHMRHLGLLHLLLPARLVLIAGAIRLLLLAGAGIVIVVIVLAGGGRRRGLRCRLLVGNASFALEAFSGPALDRADASRMLDEFGDQILGDDGIVGRLASELEVTAE